MAVLFLVLANIVLLWWNRAVRKRLADYLGLAICGGLIIFAVIDKLNSSILKLDPGKVVQWVDDLLSSHSGLVAVSSLALLALLWWEVCGDLSRSLTAPRGRWIERDREE